MGPPVLRTAGTFMRKTSTQRTPTVALWMRWNNLFPPQRRGVEGTPSTPRRRMTLPAGRTSTPSWGPPCSRTLSSTPPSEASTSGAWASLYRHGLARDLAKLALGEHESLNVASKDNDDGPDTCPGMDRRPRWLAPRGAATPWWALRFSYNPSSVSTSRFREAGSGRPSDSSHGLTGSDPGRGKSYG